MRTPGRQCLCRWLSFSFQLKMFLFNLTSFKNKGEFNCFFFPSGRTGWLKCPPSPLVGAGRAWLTPQGHMSHLMLHAAPEVPGLRLFVDPTNPFLSHVNRLFSACLLDQRNWLVRCRRLDWTRRLYSWDKTVISTLILTCSQEQQKPSPGGWRVQALQRPTGGWPGHAAFRRQMTQTCFLQKSCLCWFKESNGGRSPVSLLR